MNKVHILQVLRRPIVTEKSTLLQEQGKYVFEVALSANKAQVKEAVEEAFDVGVVAVNIINLHGKPKRFGNRRVKTKKAKKAIVTLSPGEKIQIFEGA